MSSPGLTKMLVGAGVGGGGALLTWATYSAASGGGTYVVFTGAIVFGGIQFLIGAFQFASYSLKSPEAKARDEALDALRILLLSMVAVSRADGELDEAESLAIRSIVFELIGQDIGIQTVREVADQLAKSDSGIHELIRERQPLPDGWDRLIVRACHLVSMADGRRDRSEANLVMGISVTLGMTSGQHDEIIREPIG